MFEVLICILAVQGAHSVCVVPAAICPEDTAVQAQIVGRHNAFRRAVQPTASNMLLMSYSEEIAASAQAWVDKCIVAHGAPSTRLLDGYDMGENMFYSFGPDSWTKAVDTWHREGSHFLYPNGSSNSQTIGHYTQVVWNSSYKIGCGVAMCPNNIYLYSCQYFRAGNFRGWIPYKAGPSCASCPNHCEDKLCTNPCPYINKYINCPTLKAMTGCSNALVYAWCPASCRCTDEIIPIA
ncbi:cysteine-rich venom protein latisemin [Pseudoliparis swirei]|uniref:cysteine-rich venom protein latisemin n=1 Tax=Pseudoliparis swirei TaxID=2059687 RepID=UPI0024BE6E99|nr:cysteine-rich venom protein latisemin [Pseudoliparis swirei]